jgi:prepilin-type N-terminal cleavage/methylation domain-containing protein
MAPFIPSSPLRRAFTLVELLVVIMILGILTSITTVALWGSMEEARAARTRSQIKKIDELLMVKWESYRTRPVPVKTGGLNPEVAAANRLNALRELMRLELPDRMSDLLTPAEYAALAGNGWQLPGALAAQPAGGTDFLTSYPSAAISCRRRIGQAGGWTPQQQQAECLYMIIASMQDGTRSGLDFFRDNEIGDIDGDGMPEILDGWGHPIRFLRWAPGFVSTLQGADVQPDPFDPLKLDPRWKNNDEKDRHYPTTYPTPAPADVGLDDPQQLFPLVYSAGADETYGVLHDIFDDTNGDGILSLLDDQSGYDAEYAAATAPLWYRRTFDSTYYTYAPYPVGAGVPWPTNAANGPLWSTAPINDPYVILPLVGQRIGWQYNYSSGDGFEDNIDNQSLVVR